MEDDSRGRKKNSRKKIRRMDRRVMEKFVRREYLFRINQIFVNMGKDFHDRGSCADHVEKETGSTKGIFWKREFVRCR